MPDDAAVAVAERPPLDESRDLTDELAGLDALELADRKPKLELAARLWAALWPKAAAFGLFLLIWQIVVWLKWKPDYVLPGPVPVFQQLWSDIAAGTIPTALSITLQRAFIGYSIAVVLGVVIGALVSRVRLLRVAVGSMITGLQTMPSIAWFPLALLLFKQSEGAIYFVVVLGATPAIANGLISGTDNIPPILVRAGRVLGARRLTLYRHVILPASLPTFVSGLKQGWAFAWRSLLAGELIVIIASRPSIGVMMQNDKDFADAISLLSVMIVIFVVGIVVDSLFFGTMERSLRRRWGLIDTAT